MTRFAKTGVKRVLWQLLKNDEGFTRVKVLSGPSRGTRLIIDLRTEASYWLGSYDRRLLSIITQLLKPGQVAYDCGAFLGYYAAAMRKAVGNSGKVFVFEGSSINFSRAVRLPEMNGWENVEVHHLAVGKAHSHIRFVSDQGAASGPASRWESSSNRPSGLVETVECAGIDELVYERGFAPPDFLKFDLETAERYALLNGARLWCEKRPTVLVELHKGSDTFEVAEEFLRRFSYSGTEIHLGVPVKTVSDFYSAQDEGVQCTILAIPEASLPSN
jgi:FkbM family methyltransferase